MLANKLEGFLKSPTRNIWLLDEFMKVYVRKSRRLINNNLIQTLDMATIEVYPEFQRQGRCSEFLAIAHQINPYQANFVENVQYDFLRSHLLKNGYLECPTPDCYYK